MVRAGTGISRIFPEILRKMRTGEAGLPKEELSEL